MYLYFELHEDGLFTVESCPGKTSVDHVKCSILGHFFTIDTNFGFSSYSRYAEKIFNDVKSLKTENVRKFYMTTNGENAETCTVYVNEINDEERKRWREFKERNKIDDFDLKCLIIEEL